MTFMIKIPRKPQTIVINNNSITMDMYELIELFATKITHGHYSLYQRYYEAKSKKQKVILLEKIIKHSRKRKKESSYGGLPDEYLLDMNNDNNKKIKILELSPKVINICPSKEYWKKVASKKTKKNIDY